MERFRCSRCGIIDETDTAYWREKMQAASLRKEFAPLCAECKTGRWHGRFPKTPATGHYLTTHGFVYTYDELLQGVRGRGYLVGKYDAEGQLHKVLRPPPLPPSKRALT